MARIFLHGNFEADDGSELKALLIERLESLGYQVTGLQFGPKVQPEMRKRISRVAIKSEMSQADVIISWLPEASWGPDYSDELLIAQGLDGNSGKLWIPITPKLTTVPAPILQYHNVINAGDQNVEKCVLNIVRAIELFLNQRAVAKLKRAEVRENIEKGLAGFVDEAIKELVPQEERNRKAASLCYTVGFLALLTGLGAASWGVHEAAVIPEGEWIRFSLIGLKVAVIILLSVACSRYTFHLGSSYMNEALRNANRIHAIRFGKFYLQVYGDEVEWDQLKEVFQHWNIDSTSIFAALDGDKFDPKLLDKALEVIKVSVEKTKS